MADLVPDTECAYAAGLFDGEGCVELYMRGDSSRTRNCLRTALSVSGTDLRPLQWLSERWGGKMRMTKKNTSILYETVKKELSSYPSRPMGIWTVFSLEAEEFARAIQPFLIVKQEQVDLWLYARTLIRPRGNQYGGLGIEEEEERMRVVKLVKELKSHR